MRAILLCLVSLSLLGLSALAQANRVDIFTALNQGSIRADFRGNGDSSVVGLIERMPGGPTEVVIPAGSVFRATGSTGGAWAQYGGPGAYGGGGAYGGSEGGRRPRFGQGAGGGGRQGMFGSTSTTTRLGLANAVRVTIPALCMDLGKPAPTHYDALVLLPPLNPTLIRFAQVLDTQHPAHPAAQVALWALTDDPPIAGAQRYLLDIIPGTGTALAQQRQELMAAARDVLSAAGLQPTAFSMFK